MAINGYKVNEVLQYLQTSDLFCGSS